MKSNTQCYETKYTINTALLDFRQKQVINYKVLSIYSFTTSSRVSCPSHSCDIALL